VLEAAGGAEGRSVHEAGRRNPEGARHACWARSLGAPRGARRWDAVGGGVSARHRAARGERPGRARCRRRGERRHRSQVGAGRGSREGRRASAVSAQGRASRSRSDDALFYLSMRNDNNAL